MKRIPLANGGWALVDNADYLKASKYLWNADHRRTRTYVRANAKKNGKWTTVLLHRLPLKAREVDHIKGYLNIGENG